MTVTNNKENVRYLFYTTVGGIPKSVKFESLESLEISDLESEEQIIYNSLDYKLKSYNERFGTDFDIDFTTSGSVEIGDLIDDDLYSSGNWSIIGNPDVTFNANSINLAAAGPYLNFNNGIVFDPFISNRSIIKWQGDLVVNSFGTGFYIGFRNYLDDSASNMFQALFGFDGTFGFGSISLRKGTTEQVGGVYPSSISLGDVLRVKIEIVESLVKCSMQNITTGGALTTVSSNFVYTYNFTEPFQQNTYKISLNTCGGDYTVSNLSCTSTAMTQGILIIGNSKTATAFPDTFANSFVGRLKIANPTKNIYYDASVNETVDAYLARIEDLKKYLSLKVFIVDSSNESRYGTSNVVTKMTSLKTQLEANGSQVYYVNTMPETVLDVRVINTEIEPVFTPNVLDAYSLMVDGGNIPDPLPAFIAVDGIHPNAAFQGELEDLIQPYL